MKWPWTKNKTESPIKIPAQNIQIVTPTTKAELVMIENLYAGASLLMAGAITPAELKQVQ